VACARRMNNTLVPPPAYHRAAATALHVDTLTLVTRLHLLEICHAAAQLAGGRCLPSAHRGVCLLQVCQLLEQRQPLRSGLRTLIVAQRLGDGPLQCERPARSERRRPGRLAQRRLRHRCLPLHIRSPPGA